MKLPPGLAYDAVAEEYDTDYLSPLDLAENLIVSELLAETLAGLDAPRILDLGCGTGLFLELPVSRDLEASQYVGTDVSVRMLERAQAKHRGWHFAAQDMNHLTWGTGSFDVVISLFGSPSYVESPEHLMAQLFRILAPGGRAFVMWYGRRHPGSRALAVHGIEDPPTHRLTLEDAEELALWGWRDHRRRGFSSRLAERVPARYAESWLRYETSRLMTGRLGSTGRFVILEASKRP